MTGPRLRLLACPHCGETVVRVPVYGEMIDVEPRAYPAREVASAEQLIVLPIDEESGEQVEAERLVLRRHRCPGTDSEEPVLGPPVTRAAAPSPATRTDWRQLAQLRTRAELIRAQALGRLRTHPGSRHHSPTEIPIRLLGAVDLSPARCVLCRQSLEGLTADETILVAHVAETDVADPQAEALQLYVHLPECPSKSRRDDIQD